MNQQRLLSRAGGRGAPVKLALATLVVATISRAQTESASPPNSGAPDEAAIQPARQKTDVPGDIQKARDIYDQLDANLADVPSREQLAEIERLIDEIEAADPANPWLSYLLGRAYALSGRAGDAIDQLRKFVNSRDGRNDWKAHRLLGDLFATEFPRLAQGSYEKAAELMPNDPSVLSGLSNCASRAGNLDEAVRLARLAAEADGYKNVRYAYRLSRALMARQQWDEAETAAKKALAVAEGRVRTDPGKRTYWQVLMEQYGLHIELISARIALSPTVDDRMYARLADLMLDRADVMNRLARHDVAAVLESAVDKSGESASLDLRLRFAASLAEADRPGEAIREYEKVLASEPGNRPATEALDRLRKSPE